MNMCPPQGIDTSSIPYRDKKPARPGTWNSQAHLISVFGTNEFVATDNTNIETFLLRIVEYIKDIKLSDEDWNTLAVSRFSQITWTLIYSIYKGGWDKLKMKNQDKIKIWPFINI